MEEMYKFLFPVSPFYIPHFISTYSASFIYHTGTCYPIPDTPACLFHFISIAPHSDNFFYPLLLSFHTRLFAYLFCMLCISYTSPWTFLCLSHLPPHLLIHFFRDDSAVSVLQHLVHIV